jgi:DNA-binding NarL/FixJ family response regulator
MQPARRRTDPPRDLWAPDPTQRRLTPREQEIALLTSADFKDILIARRLGLSLSHPGCAWLWGPPARSTGLLGA